MGELVASLKVYNLSCSVAFGLSYARWSEIGGSKVKSGFWDKFVFVRRGLEI